MCGRYSIVISEDKLRQQFGASLDLPPAGLPLNYNMAPTQSGAVITDRAADRVQLFQWGLVPFWAKDVKIGSRMINARRESIAEKPSYRQAIRQRRCLVLADSFYEWRRDAGGKTPFRILPADDKLLVMAGIWERWQPRDGQQEDTLYTYSIITGPPNGQMQSIHDRMPMLLLDEEEQSRWLDEDSQLEDVLSLLQPVADDRLRLYPISSEVNNVRNNGPALHESVAA